MINIETKKVSYLVNVHNILSAEDKIYDYCAMLAALEVIFNDGNLVNWSIYMKRIEKSSGDYYVDHKKRFIDNIKNIVGNGWEPITLYKSNDIVRDGNHRFALAIFLNKEHITCKYSNVNFMPKSDNGLNSNNFSPFEIDVIKRMKAKYIDKHINLPGYL